MKKTVVLALAALSVACTKPPMDQELVNVGFVGVFAPMPCENLGPAYAVVTINGKELVFDVFEQNGGIASMGSFAVEKGPVQWSRPQVFDANGNLLFYTQDYNETGWTVIPHEGTFLAENGRNLVAQLFCDAFFDN